MTNIFKKLQEEQFQAQITPRTEESTEWLRKKIQSMSRVGPERVMGSLEDTRIIDLGSMVMFTYSADHGTVIRKKEPLYIKGDRGRYTSYEKLNKGSKNILHPGFYDKFPVVIITDVYGKHEKYLEGINFHYLAPLDRARLLDILLPHDNENANQKLTNAVEDVEGNEHNFDIQKLYQTIATMSNGGKIANHPAFKRYKFSNIQSKIVKIKNDEWEIAAFLPTGQFKSSRGRGPYSLGDSPPSKQQVYQWSKRKLR